MNETDNYRYLQIKIPPEVLSNVEMSFNEKIILGLDYTFSLIKGYNVLSNIQIGKMFNLHPNIVGYCRKNLLKNGYLLKDKRSYFLTEKVQKDSVSSNDKRTIY